MHDELLKRPAARAGVETEAPTPRARAGGPPLWPAGLWVEAALVAGFAAITALLLFEGPVTDLDLSVRAWCDAHQLASLRWLSRNVMILSEEIPILITALLLSFQLSWRRGSTRPIFPVGSAAILSAILVVGLKRFTDRPAPFEPGPIEILTVPGRESYPSGHMVNAIVWYGVLTVLIAPYLSRRARWVIRVPPPLLAFASTVYLDYHWVSDDAAGLLLGLLVYRIVCRIPWSAVPLPFWLERQPQPADRPWP